MDNKFYWGAATSAHQVEGGNHNDWTEWEHANSARLAIEAARRRANAHMRIPDYILKNYPNPLLEENYISGRACDHYNRFEEDFDIAKFLGHNAHRFSIEWSRIEPEEGKFDEKEIEHYRRVIRALRARGLEPFVTLWHWTLPVWLAEMDGILNKKFPDYFFRFCEFVVGHLKEDVGFWITLNEPTSVIADSYYRGVWPPQKSGAINALKAFLALSRAHTRAYHAIRAIDKTAQVGFVHIILDVESASKRLIDKVAVFSRKFLSNKFFLWLVRKKNIGDFMAIDYYFHFKIKFPFQIVNENKTISDMGWEIYPEGLYRVLKSLKKYNKPIYITENGVADARDALRANFIKDHVAAMKRAMDEGVDVRGYFYWSLLDNFEWDKGFWPRFGLVEVDYKTMKRRIRPSAWEYKKLITDNS